MHICISELLIVSNDDFRSRKYISAIVILYKPESAKYAEGSITSKTHQYQFRFVFIANYQNIWFSPDNAFVLSAMLHIEK